MGSMMKDTHAIDQERQRRSAELAADLRDVVSFPPLPPSPAEVGDLTLQVREHVQALGWGNREQLYTASQVRAVMSECAIMSAARERERHADVPRPLTDEQMSILMKMLDHYGDDPRTSCLRPLIERDFIGDAA